jgi:hypothetical protein
VRSPETYAGYERTERFTSRERLACDSRRTYSPPIAPALNQWGLGGLWNVSPERGALQEAPGKVVFRFHSRDLHMVLGPAKKGSPVRFKVTLDGAAPGDNHGVDSDPDGSGEVREPRMYHLIRQKGECKTGRLRSNSSMPASRFFRSRLANAMSNTGGRAQRSRLEPIIEASE